MTLMLPREPGDHGVDGPDGLQDLMSGGCALSELDAGELLDAAESLGPCARTGVVLEEATTRECVSQRDRVRLVGLLHRQAEWTRAAAALTLAQAMADAEDAARLGELVSSPRSLVAEVALVCGVSSWQARQLARVGCAGLADPLLGEPLAVGRVSVGCADSIRRAAGRVEELADQERVTRLGTRMAGAGHNRRDVERACEKLAADLCPQGFSGAHEVAFQERHVRFRPRAAGMGTLTVFGAVDQLTGLMDAADAAARRFGSSDPRTMDQRRHDALISLVLTSARVDGSCCGRTGNAGGGGVGWAGRYQVLVRMDAATLLGLDDRPGLVLGVGPVPAEVGRLIARDATWRALLTDLVSGRPVWAGGRELKAGLVLGETREDWPGCGPPPDGGDPDGGRPSGGRPGRGPDGGSPSGGPGGGSPTGGRPDGGRPGRAPDGGRPDGGGRGGGRPGRAPDGDRPSASDGG
ncbi:MAG: DUF222 domain-containing protein, partial [Bifidobacteriaceae bacterium]|nr:DUF222 domain-containing protein [Bifidobacteriaceae bacterium]